MTDVVWKDRLKCKRTDECTSPSSQGIVCTGNGKALKPAVVQD
jgi:hypothetical protein